MPIRHATNCAKPSPVFGLCASPDWCAVEPSAASELNSPFFEHDPTAYDVYVQAEYTRSTVFAESSDAHTLSAGQQTQLLNMWTTEPSLCWDGSSGGCAGAADLKYRAAIHAYPGTGVAVADDRFWNEMPLGNGGQVFIRSQAYARMGGALRYANVAGFAFAWHNSTTIGINQGGSKLAFWSNGSQSSGFARAVFSHEIGHSLGLNSPNLGHFSAGPDSNCCNDGSACNSYNANCGTAATQIPFPASAMSESYYRTGAFPMQAQPPTSASNTTVCAQTNLRFSKGLLAELDEISLDETMQPANPGWAEWQLRFLAQQLFCYAPQAYSGTYATPLVTPFALLDDDSARYGPYCDTTGGSATTCYFNWRTGTAAPTQPETTPYQADLTCGRWTGGASSNVDVLRDFNEWARMIALGRQRLKEETNPDMCLYASTYNGAVVTDDYCGWQETTTNTNVTAAKVNYPTSGCFVNGDCASNSCKFDTCGQPADCRDPNQACAGGVCICANDDDCFSGQCVDSKCVTAWGGCGCANGGQCAGTGDECNQTDSQCRGYVVADNAKCPANGPDLNQPFALLDSADFNGTDARLKLHGGTNSRLEALSGSYQNVFTLKFDFRFDGFHGSETTHVLFKSGAFLLTIVSASGQIQVQAQTGSHTALVYSGLQIGRWYRGVWSARNATDGEHFLWLRKWGVRSGWYEAGTAATDCVYQPSNWTLPSTGDVWIGHDGSSDTALFFNGRADNVSLLDYNTTRPANCTAQ